jgi:hypothetical protein
MQHKTLLHLLIIAILALCMLPVPVSAQDAGVDPETALEQARALAAEQAPAIQPTTLAVPSGAVDPLFIGVDDTTVPAYTVNPTTNAFTPHALGVQVWGSAYDAVNDIVYINNGSTLYAWPVGGAIATLGTITDPAGATQSMTGLAFYNGTLYGVKNIANEAVYAIDTTTRVATVYIDYVDADFDLGGLAADPNTGTIYATNDDTTPNGSGLFRINPDGSGTQIAPYPAGQTDIDGLAVSHDGFAYLVTDEPGSIYVWDFGAAAYATPLNNPWTSSEVFSAGAWILPASGGDPNIDVDPLSLASIQAPNTTTQQTLNVANTGGGTLNWQIDEESTLFEAGTPSGSKDAPAGPQTLSAGGPYAHGMKAVAPVFRGGEALVNDGSFENGPPPGSAWTETTNSTCEWIGDWSGVWGVAAYDGIMDFWGGGYCNGTVTTSSVAQTVAVPPANTTLSFWIISYRPDADDPDLDQAYVEVNGTPVWTYDLIQANNTYPNWVNVTVDLSAYAGQNVSLELGATSAGASTGNIRFDYVEFAGPPSPACTVLSDMPWLSLAPTSGANSGGTDIDVTVTFDSTGMAQGVYTGNLCVTSDDPDPGPGNETDLVIVPVTLTVTEPPRCPVGTTEITLLSQTFEGSFPPAGWSVNNTTTGCGSGSPDWTNTDPGANGNLTGGTGLFATADSDACGSGVAMNAQMWSPVLDMTGLTDPQISFAYDYNDLGSADSGALDISTDGGATWANEYTWTVDDRGPKTYTSGIAGAGENDVVVRWHYVSGWDWWWQVDDVVVTACEPVGANPAITLDKTVGTDPLVCAATDQITVPAGTDVTYCYEVTNTGNVEFNTHDLVDSELGTLLSNFPYTLAAGASAFLTETTTINVTTVNTATWTASSVTGPSVQASDVATVTVQTAGGPEIELTKTVGVVPAVCAVTDNITITAGTQVYYCYQVENTGTVALNYHDLVDSELGVLANDLPYALGPGATHEIIVPETPMVSVTNTATWTAMTALGAYVYDDTVAFNYIPINATGTPLGLADDGEANITLPFSFTFYGVSSSNLRVGNNGGILFNATTGEVGFSNVALPNAGHPLAIFPFWDDLDSDTGDVYWEVQGTAPNRMAIIEWYNRPHFSNVGAATFEVILYEGSNEIKFQYLDTDFGNAAYDFGATATSGLNKDGTTALQYSYNQAVLTNNKAILFYEVIPQSATDSDSATVTVQTPNIDVSPLSLTETHLTPPQTTNQTLTVANTGQGTLTWNIVEEPVLVRPARLTGGDASVAADVADASSFKAPEQTTAPAPLSDWRAPEVVLYDNGPLVTHPGGGAGGADASALQTALGLTTYGAGNQAAAGNRVADDFTVTGGGWFINTMTFFGYQTGSGTTSTFTALNLRIWDGPPNLGSSNVVFGDTTTNRLASSTWANMYRVLDTGLLDTARPVMANVATVNTFLPAGTYWVDWQADGTLASGPWAPPISILGQTTTGNAWQFTSTGWAALMDGAFPQGLPFIVDGLADCSNPADVPWLSVSPTSGSNAGGSSTPVTVGFDSTSLANGTYTARLCVFSNDPNTGPGNETSLVIVPVTLIVGDPTAVTLDGLSAAPLPVAGLPVAALPAAIGLALGAVYALRRRKD